MALRFNFHFAGVRLLGRASEWDIMHGSLGADPKTGSKTGCSNYKLNHGMYPFEKKHNCRFGVSFIALENYVRQVFMYKRVALLY